VKEHRSRVAMDVWEVSSGMLEQSEVRGGRGREWRERERVRERAGEPERGEGGCKERGEYPTYFPVSSLLPIPLTS